jgi:hypothetical protein
MVAKILYSGTITQVSKFKNFPSNGNNKLNSANFKRKNGVQKEAYNLYFRSINMHQLRQFSL